MTTDSIYRTINEQLVLDEKERISLPLIRFWDGDWNLYGELHGELGGVFEYVRNDTGTASVDIPLNHYIAEWVINFRGRAKRNVHITFDKSGSRWGGRMHNFKVVRKKDGKKFLTVTFKHDLEELKHIRCWSNPFLPSEIQVPRVWTLFGPARWALATTLFVNIMRLEASLWMLPDDPMDVDQWFDLDMSNWSMVVKPVAFLKDNSPVTTVFSRFKTFHEVAKRVLQDGQITIEARRWLEGDEPPWEGAPPLHNGCLVFEFVDKSGWNTETSFFGNLLTGLQRAFVNIGSDGVTEGIDVIQNPNFPDEYYEPGWSGTLPEAPWVIFEESPYTGIESSEFVYYPATDVQIVAGGHSLPGINEGMSAAVIALGGAIGSMFGQSQIGAAIDAVAAPLYTDTIGAFMAHKFPERAQELGWSHYHEGWAEGADRAYTLAALIALRTGAYSTRERTAVTLKFSDAVPYRIGTRGYGDLFVGDRVGFSVAGMPENEVYVECIEKCKYEWDGSGRGWEATVGQREPQDGVLWLAQQQAELAAGLQDLGML
ncbi:minor tail protein [Rhodococcus phage Hiro]|uniref:Minor tail protein n=3 Tax=Rerduovirus TaxID=1982375 RepID=A0A222ZI19_9CAUD|nr:minor tail protein [Rhodococcus phage Hiro]ASR84207.1 minor tail protein [Rhodococcus phage Hiro]ASR84403.1 minor tail protein [Rhodococcus phage Krishelle]AST15187.1 minor tail protein [Rhodococcus phage AppleCloud]